MNDRVFTSSTRTYLKVKVILLVVLGDRIDPNSKSCSHNDQTHDQAAADIGNEFHPILSLKHAIDPCRGSTDDARARSTGGIAERTGSVLRGLVMRRIVHILRRIGSVVGRVVVVTFVMTASLILHFLHVMLEESLEVFFVGCGGTSATLVLLVDNFSPLDKGHFRGQHCRLHRVSEHDDLTDVLCLSC